MEIRDILHGAITVDSSEASVIDSPFFQRLRQIRQLGFAEVSFPSATHNRFIHSLGAMHVATECFQAVFKGNLASPVYNRLRAVLRLGALLHDVGHGPLSHTTEFAMPKVSTLGLPLTDSSTQDRKATHEDYTLKIILDSELTPILQRVGKPHGFNEKHIAALIDPSVKCDEDFFIDELHHQKVSFQPILQQLISSELDADRMDYLRRDSLLSGVSYGQFDYTWILKTLTYYVIDQSVYLTLGHKGLYAFEDFLIARHHMFLMVYFHHKTVIFDSMLARYLEDPACAFQIPSNITEYIRYDDAFLYSHLSQSKNPWAERIARKQAFRVFIELHSGIPADPAAQQAQKDLLEQVRQELDHKGIFYLHETSVGEISKYVGKETIPIYVKYDDQYSKPRFIPLDQCTDLFKKYAEKRSITRIYVSPEDYEKLRRTR